MDPVQKSRRERWTAEAVKALQKAVETHLRGDNDVNWAGVARELGTTADRVKKKWRKLQKNDNTGAVSEPHASGSHAKIPYAKRCSRGMPGGDLNPGKPKRRAKPHGSGGPRQNSGSCDS